MEGTMLLGSGGWIPTSSRATCCALVRTGDHALVIDAGTGLGRLVEHPDLLQGVRTLDLLLTHFHLDHVVGLAYLPALELNTRPRVLGPGGWLYGDSTAAILARLIGPPLFPIGLSEIAAIGEIPAEGISLGPIEVRARVQRRHSDPTLALRVGNRLSYCTDTAHDQANAEFARGSMVLAHEAWFTEDEPREEAIHSSAHQAAEVARNAAVDQLALIHVRPGVDERRLREEAHEVFPSTAVGSDLLRLG